MRGNGFRCPRRIPGCRCGREVAKGDPGERVLRRDARARGYLCVPQGWEMYCRYEGLTSAVAEYEQRRRELS